MIIENLNSSLKEAMKAGRSADVGTIRLLISAIRNKEIEKRGKGEAGELTEAEVIEVLEKEAKKRRESAEVYAQAGREDLRSKEAEELAFIEKYLPAKMSAEEVSAAIDQIIANGANDFAGAMKEAMKELKGKADAGLVTKIVKEKLGL